jgi:DNA-binding response OmpR family regulator
MATFVHEFSEKALRGLRLSPSAVENRKSIIETGDFTIDLEQRMVTVRGHEISLSDAEFDLLVFLTTHRRKVVTPRTLLITRWVQRETRQEDFLAVLLSLRKKLDSELPGQHYVRMEPWVLCRFEPSTT